MDFHDLIWNTYLYANTDILYVLEITIPDHS